MNQLTKQMGDDQPSKEQLSTMEKITGKFVEEHLIELLSNLRPDLTFEYFSKHADGWLNSNGWNIKIDSNEGELLGEYQNGKLVSGKDYDDNEENKNAIELHKTLKLEAEKTNTIFSLYLNKLLIE